MQYDAIILGAGAAGLIAAVRAAERGRRVLLLEKNTKAGVKILMSGGTRCNLTHHTDKRGIISAFGKKQGSFLQSALAAFGPADVRAFFHDEGVATKVEETGKVFPCSDRALDVQQALLRRLRRSGADLALAEPARDVIFHDDRVQVVTETRTIDAANLLLTTGGVSYPGCGTTGDGYAWAARVGHTIIQPRPALVPLKTSEVWLQELSGVTLPRATVSVVAAAGLTEQETRAIEKSKRMAARYQWTDAVLCTHWGLSGPAVMNISRELVGDGTEGGIIRLDLVPDMTEDQLRSQLDECTRQDGKRHVITWLGRHLPRRLATALAVHEQVEPEKRLAELSRTNRQRLLDGIKRLPISVTGTLGFPKAEVTAGGVDLVEVDSKTMTSKRHPRLRLAGEILDLDGPIGGYNFQAAFSTGWLAASHL